MLLVNDNPIIEGFHLKDCMEKVHRDLMATGSNKRGGDGGNLDPNRQISCHYTYLPKGFDPGEIKTLNQKIMTTYRLLIAIEYALPNCPLVDFRN